MFYREALDVKKIGIGYENYKEFIDKDMYYIDKTMLIRDLDKRGGKVTYQIRGRSGVQDFVFVPFNPKSKYVVTMYVSGEKTHQKEGADICQIHLSRLSARQTIKFTINYLDDKANKDLVESFAIINYNQQK